MNILITGVAGLLGSRLADWILENTEHKVIGLDDLSGGYKENISDSVLFYKKDLSCEDITDVFDENNIDIVFHFAAYAAEGLSPFIREYNYKSNLVATAKIINKCIEKNIDRLVFTSSMAVYGHGSPPFEESDLPCPIDPYGIAKYACEMDIKIAGEQHGLDWCIVRPHNVYGKKQNIWDRYRNVLGIWMYQYLNNYSLTIYGDGKQKRAFSYIDDCLEPLWAAATSKKASKQIINLGGIEDYSINEACDILIDVMGGGKKVFLSPRHEVKYAFSTYKKSIDILDGLTDMWEWAKKQPNRERFEWSEYELEKGIYSFWKKK
jgi:UDP-glucose 4-epimerase